MLGEAMLRLSPPSFGRLETASSLDVHVGGAEANVAVGLARRGRRVAWLSSVPDNALGRRVLTELRAQEVDVSHVRRTVASRLGLYFVEIGAGPRASNVLYDRAWSAMAAMREPDVAWEVVRSARMAFTTGITAALSGGSARLATSFLERARDAGAMTALDVNHRARLWSARRARTVLDPLCRLAQVIIVARRDAATVFGWRGEPEAVAERLALEFGAGIAVVTLGSAGAVASWQGRLVAADPVPTGDAAAVDPFGAGDAFAAALLDGVLGSAPPEAVLQRATRVAALQRTVPGDLPLVDEAELLDQEDGVARIRR